MTERELYQALGRLEGKLDGMLEDHKQLFDYIKGVSKRVGAMELREARRMGWTSGVAAVVALIVTWIGKLLT